MTKKDKKLIADYMHWPYDSDGSLNLNDAGLVVQEMQKRGDWGVFINHTWSKWSAQWRDLQALYEFVFHLFNADNFFKAFTEWRKGIKLDPVIDKESAAYMDN